MPKRKTIDVEALKEHANKMLRDSVDEVTEGRISVAVFIEWVLMETGNYKGFRYLPGVYEYDYETLTATLIGDEARRQYY